MSFWTEDLFTLDNLLHATGGAALAALAVYLPWSIPIVWVIWGLMRERAQSKDEPWWVPFSRWHKALEGVAWGVGAIVPVVIYYTV